MSSTYKFTNSDFLIRYADGSYAKGDYATDTLNFGGKSITNVPFGIGYDSTSSQGILGVGYAANEASVGTNGRTYQNLPQILVQEKIINSNAYSLWLNDLSANTGSILFGGVDMDKYNGDLQTLPVIKEQGDYREFIVALTSVVAAGQKIITNTPIPVLLDSGSSLTYLPDQYAQAIFTVLNAQYSNSAGAAVVSCSLMNSDKTVDFSFSGLTIKVPLNELVIVDGVRNRQPVCILGMFDPYLPLLNHSNSFNRYQRCWRLHCRPRRHLLAQRICRLRLVQQPNLPSADKLQCHQQQRSRNRQRHRRRTRRKNSGEPSVYTRCRHWRRPQRW
jgi:hypothetical protein